MKRARLLQAGLELPAFSTLDAMEAEIRGEVNAQICAAGDKAERQE